MRREVRFPGLAAAGAEGSDPLKKYLVKLLTSKRRELNHAGLLLLAVVGLVVHAIADVACYVDKGGPW